MTTCAETDCPFRTFGGWCGLTACIRRNTTTEIGANPGWVIPEDYVKVVRCRDCKHAQMTFGGECKYCDFWQEDGGEALYLDGDFYCAAGERRESE